MLPPLPVETLDHIIYYFHEDRTALLACSLVSPSWRASSQFHIFRHVDISQRRVSECLPPVLAAAPHLAAHIRSVTIPITLNAPACSAFLAFCPLPRVTDLNLIIPAGERWNRTFTRADIRVARLGDAFPGVRVLGLENSKLNSSFNDPAPLTALAGVFPHITHMRLGFVEMPNSSTQTAFSLDTLILDGCFSFLRKSGTEEGDFLQHIRHIRCLRLRDVSMPHNQLLPSVGTFAMRNASTLQEIDIEAPIVSAMEVFTDVYRARTGALRALRLCINMGIDPPRSLERLVQILREIGPDDQVHVTLVAVWPIPDANCTKLALAVREMARVPFPWKCTIHVDGVPPQHCVCDVCRELKVLGVSVVGPEEEA